MTSIADPPDVGKGNDEVILARFVAARGAGDIDAMVREWNALTEVFFPRLRAMVATTSHGKLDPHERETAESNACVRFLEKLIWSFRGTSIGELVNATKTLVAFACTDVQREAATRHSREASLDRGYGADDDAGAEPYAGAMRKRHDDDRAAAADDEAADDLYASGRDFLAWALPRLGERQRIVIELDRAGKSTEEMQDALGGASRDVVYQTRRRALHELDKLKEQYS